MTSSAETHEVFNQPPFFEGTELFSLDTPLKEAVAREAEWALSKLVAYGKRAGSEMMEQGFLANENKPVYHCHDRFGHRINQVDFHPAYHQLMAATINEGGHSIPWTENRKGAYTARAAIMYLHNQVEAGTCCPLTMTFASVAALRHQPDLAKEWEPLITSGVYDPSNKPWFEKQGVTIGMAMTEKQGGTDVRANTTTAVAVETEGPGQLYRLTGHKWFCSAPMCDAFLTLAQTEKGLSCFLLPRWKKDGTLNEFYVQRLKNKLGNLANASSEVEYRGAEAWMVGQEGRGVATIIDMVALTRFDCMIGSSAIMRQAVSQAIHHCSYRQVFGKTLIDQPIMQGVLADLALESEAALAITMRLATALENQQQDQHEARLARIVTAIGKYWICKRAPFMINEAQECLGGAGYVEESILPRLYREAPVNSIWEGSGNVQCLDVLRALQKDPDTLTAVLAEIGKAANKHLLLANWLDSIQSEMANQEDILPRSRLIVEKLAVALQASALLQNGDSKIADAFCQTRLDPQSRGQLFGALPAGIDCNYIIQRNKLG
ncbi:acyl-CoA dehydrogenase family protein [Endozoicomonadaceae bacterium StTr2]